MGGCEQVEKKAKKKKHHINQTRLKVTAFPKRYYTNCFLTVGLLSGFSSKGLANNGPFITSFELGIIYGSVHTLLNAGAIWPITGNLLSNPKLKEMESNLKPNLSGHLQ